MKLKLLLATLLAAATMSGCSTDPPGSATYIYKNDTSQEITVKAYTKNNDNPKPLYVYKKGFVIAPGAEHSMRFDGDIAEIPEPFDLRGQHAYVTISDGEREISQMQIGFSEKEGILNKKNYQLVRQKDYHATYKYVFTDKSFETNQTEHAVYYYHNDSSRDITLKLYHLNNGVPVLDLEFTIIPSDQKSISLQNDQGLTPKPFTIDGTIHESSYLTLSNGAKEVTQYYQSTEPNLFDLYSYKIISKHFDETLYQYTFTHLDFDNAEPIGN